MTSLSFGSVDFFWAADRLRADVRPVRPSDCFKLEIAQPWPLSFELYKFCLGIEGYLLDRYCTSLTILPFANEAIMATAIPICQNIFALINGHYGALAATPAAHLN